MLRSFRVANHKSIRGEQELLLIPAYDRNLPTLPVAAIFGANASGKSNLLDALGFMRAAVRRSYADWEPRRGVPRTPFKLDPAGVSQPSRYSVELLLDGVRYFYGFVADDERIREEWLYSYPRSRKRVLFERSLDGEWTFGTSVARPRAELVRDLTRPNALFLSAAAQADFADVMPVYEWFRSGCVILGPPDWGKDLHRLVRLLADNSPIRDAVVDVVRAADTGLSDVHVDQAREAQLAKALADYHASKATLDATTRFYPEPGEWSGSPDAERDFAEARFVLDLAIRERDLNPVQDLMFFHGPNRTPLTLFEQSNGTQALLNLVTYAVEALGQGSALLVDEIDSSLHPRLTARVIELFRDKRTNPHGAQLIVTTHDASLLGTSLGREVLARDQVWFVEKDRDGATSLFPLSDFRPRKGENAERRYLGGSYGAVPAVFSDTLVDQLLETRSQESARGTS